MRLDDLGAEALPSVMRKVIEHALGHTAQPPAKGCDRAGRRG